MQSMTGYGKAEYNQDGVSLVVELKTVNNRFLDIVPKYPRFFVCFDDLIRKTISNKLSRGRIELFVTLVDNRESDKSISVDKSVARGYYQAFNSLKELFPDLNADMTVSSFMRMPDVIVESNSETDNEFFEKILVETLNEALDKLNQMRLVEGDKLKADMLMRVDLIEKYVGEIKERAPLVKDFYRAKITDRVREALGDAKFDESRILQEVAMFADKSNIDEELTRLGSHIQQFRDIVKAENAGRKLDFLVQEFNREVNTICSKSNDLPITKLGLSLKCEIEKIREQVQNIE